MATSYESAAMEYSDEPAVLIFADSMRAREAAEKAVRAAGGRVGATLPVSAALDRLQNQVTVGAVVVELEEEAPGLDDFLSRLDQATRSGRHPTVVIVPRGLIDIAMARTGEGEVDLLAEPDEFQRAAAIGAAIARRPHRLGDVSSEGQNVRLQELSDEVARIAKALASLASDEGFRMPGLTPVNGEGASAAVDAGLVRTMIRARRLRDQFFPSTLFADPAWDMLLDLAAARLEGRAVAVSSLCIAAAVPPTTALRWIKTLTDGKLFARVADHSDGRRVFIELTEQATAGMMAYFAAFQRMMALRN